MNDRLNGAVKQGIEDLKTETLGGAIERHASTLLKANQLPNGMMQINPAQMYCDLELAQVRIEILFEALVARGMVDPAELTTKLRDKLNAESDMLQQQLDAPKLEIARGSIPRSQ